MVDTETRVCNLCGRIVPKAEFCNACVERVAQLPNPQTMTVEERLAEFNSYDCGLTIPFSQMHERLEKLVGRPIWTHDFARWEWLRKELIGNAEANLTPGSSLPRE